MRERLVELLDNATGTQYYGDEIIKTEIDIDEDDIKRIADYLLANGVIVPPIELCEQTGGTIFIIADGEPTEVMLLGVAFNYWGQDEIATYDDQMEKVRNYRFADIGKTVFLTKEEAEQALRKDEGK